MTTFLLGSAFAVRLDERATDMAIRRTADDTLVGATALPASAAEDLRRLADEIDRRRGRLPLQGSTKGEAS